MHTKPRFIHVLATRLGIGVYDEAWYDYRLRLFETITVPSMRAQTTQDFYWLIVVDSHIPAAPRRRVETAIAGMPRARIVEVEFKTDFKKTIVDWAKQQAAAEGYDYVLSSRLDDDDALRTDFFARLHTEAEDFLARTALLPRRAVFSFTLGTMWVPSHQVGYTRYHDSHSLGLSLMEPIGIHKSVYHWTHTEIKQSLASQGTYLRGIDGDDIRWWLYAAHPLAVTDRGDNARFKKVMGHKYRYELDDALLGSFGLDPAAVANLGAEPTPQQAPASQPLSQRALDIEREIKNLRRQEEQAGMLERQSIRRKLKSLQTQRRMAGSDIVAG